MRAGVQAPEAVTILRVEYGDLRVVPGANAVVMGKVDLNVDVLFSDYVEGSNPASGHYDPASGAGFSYKLAPRLS